MRKRLYEIIEVADENDKASEIYDMFMVVVILVSLAPLAFKETNAVLGAIENICVLIFIIDYLARWITADYKLERGALSFVIYPFMPFAIVDLLAILPSFSLFGTSFEALKGFRVLRIVRILRIFKAFRYSESFITIRNVIRRQKNALLVCWLMAIISVFVNALIVFNIEPETFDNLFHAIYWATVSLTTVGYGDVYPKSFLGQVFTVLTSMLGIAIVALPSGIITAGYMDELNRQRKAEEDHINEMSKMEAKDEIIEALEDKIFELTGENNSLEEIVATMENKKQALAKAQEEEAIEKQNKQEMAIRLQTMDLEERKKQNKKLFGLIKKKEKKKFF